MANKTVKPTGWEQSQIDKRLKAKYPHMLEESWVNKLKDKTRKALAKRRGAVGYQMGKAGATRKETERMGYK